MASSCELWTSSGFLVILFLIGCIENITDLDANFRISGVVRGSSSWPRPDHAWWPTCTTRWWAGEFRSSFSSLDTSLPSLQSWSLILRFASLQVQVTFKISLILLCRVVLRTSTGILLPDYGIESCFVSSFASWFYLILPNGFLFLVILVFFAKTARVVCRKEIRSPEQDSEKQNLTSYVHFAHMNS